MRTILFCSALLFTLAVQGQQYLRPSATNTVNQWTLGGTTPAATHHASVNETVSNDAVNWTRNVGTSGSQNLPIEFQLPTPAADPGAGTCTLRVRAMATGGSANEQMTVGLYNGATLIANVIPATQITRTTWNTYTGTIARTSITDFSNLRLRINMNQGAASEYIHVSWVEFEVPNAGPARRVTIF